MKHRIFTVFAVLIFLSGGSQAVLGQEGTALDRGNTVPANMLPVELQDLDIKDYFISSDAKEVGVIQTMTGHLVMRHGDSGQAYFAVPGDKIFEKDVMLTLKESRCRVKFIDDNLMTLAEDTNINIKEFVVDLEMKEKRSVFAMAKGKAMFYALKLFKYGKVSMSVETPTAVAGIRGTKFGIEVKEKSGGSMASRPVYLADASETGWIRFAQNSPGDSGTVGSYTIVYSFDGTVTVTSTVSGESVTLSTGEFVYMFTTGAGEVAPTPEGLSKLFQDDTDTSAPDGDDGGDGDGGDDGNGDGDNGDTGGNQGGDVAQTQTGQNMDEEAAAQGLGGDTGGEDSSPRYGYFSNMVRDLEDTFAGIVDVLVSSSPQDFNSNSIRGDGIDEVPQDYAEVGGPVSCLIDPYLKTVYVDGVINTYGTGYPISLTETGSNEYQSWGYWTMAGTFEVHDPYGGDEDYNTCEIESKGYYIYGDITPSDVASGIVGAYSGVAYGTYSGGSGLIAQDMIGTFGCNVNVTSGDIGSFQLEVDNGVLESDPNFRAAQVTGGSGSFSGSSFTIDAATSTLTNGEMTYDSEIEGSAAGALYGPNGEYMGGAWGIIHTGIESESRENGAAGLFQGERGGITTTPGGGEGGS